MVDRANGASALGRTPKLPALTGLRILAALTVYFSHIPPPNGAPKALGSFLQAGYMGVTLFFCLSGFVLALNYFERVRRPSARATWDFAGARFARIYPLYILILFYIFVHNHAFGESLSGWWEHVLVVQAWSSNVYQVFNFNGPAWSVSVEVFLYACFPVLVLALARLHRPWALLSVGTLVVLATVVLAAWFVSSGRGELPWTDPESAHRWLYLMPVTRLGDFILGMLAARLYADEGVRARMRRFGGPLAVLAALTIVAFMAWPANLDSAWSWDVTYALPSVVLIFGLAVAPRTAPARALSIPVVVLLGESSYAFYLIHQRALEYFGAGRWATATSITTILYETLTLGAILCLAVGLHVMIERPARVAIRRLLGSRSGRASTTTAVAEPETTLVASGAAAD